MKIWKNEVKRTVTECTILHEYRKNLPYGFSGPESTERIYRPVRVLIVTLSCTSTRTSTRAPPSAPPRAGPSGCRSSGPSRYLSPSGYDPYERAASTVGPVCPAPGTSTRTLFIVSLYVSDLLNVTISARTGTLLVPLVLPWYGQKVRVRAGEVRVLYSYPPWISCLLVRF